MEIRDKIINSSYELFSLKGYEKTTIREIINQAECSKGGFYHHFKSKEEILELIVSNYMDDITKHFDNIEFRDRGEFIDKFNSIFVVISEYKLKQLTEWSKLNNIFMFSGNDRILKQLKKQFKLTVARVYLELISTSKEYESLNYEYIEIVSDLCSRVIIWIFEAVGKPIYSEDAKEYNKFVELLDFCEDQISHALGVKKEEVKYKDAGISYLRSVKEYYKEHKEGLR